MIDGIKIKLGGVDVVLPPLNLKGLRKVLPLMERWNASLTLAEQVDMMVPIFHAALLRNYPDLTIDEMEDRMNADEVIPAINALPGLLELSGLVQVSRSGEPGAGSR